jgi:hypothetical protein
MLDITQASALLGVHVGKLAEFRTEEDFPAPLAYFAFPRWRIGDLLEWGRLNGYPRSVPERDGESLLTREQMAIFWNVGSQIATRLVKQKVLPLHDVRQGNLLYWKPSTLSKWAEAYKTEENDL